jgi:hypothetical protein
MSEAYVNRVKAIRTNNQPILDAFEEWLLQAGLSPKTVKSQLSDIGIWGVPGLL